MKLVYYLTLLEKTHSFTVWITVCSTILNWGVFTLWFTVWITGKVKNTLIYSVNHSVLHNVKLGRFHIVLDSFHTVVHSVDNRKRKEHTHSHSFTVWITLCFTLCSQCELWFHTVIHTVNECEWVCSFQQGSHTDKTYNRPTIQAEQNIILLSMAKKSRFLLLIDKGCIENKSTTLHRGINGRIVQCFTNVKYNI